MVMAAFMMLAVQPAPYSPTHKAAACAASDIVHIAPGDALQLLDDFRSHLIPADRARLDRALPRAADGGVAACDSTTGSRASCEAAAYMPALRSTGLMPRFLATICPRDAAKPSPIATPRRADRPSG